MNYGNPATSNLKGTPSWANFGRAPQQNTPAPAPAPTVNPWGDNPWFSQMDSNPTNYSEWQPYIDLAKLRNAGDQGIRDIYGSMPQYTSARLGAINALSPGGVQGVVDAVRSRAMAGANESGRQSAAMLRSMGIEGQDASSMLDARNRAADATNTYDANANSPEGQAQRLMQIMGLSSPEAAAPIMQLINSLFGGANAKTQQNDAAHAQRASQRGFGGILGQVLGMATGGGGGFGSLFGGGGGDQYDWSGSGYGSGAIGRV